MAPQATRRLLSEFRTLGKDAVCMAPPAIRRLLSESGIIRKHATCATPPAVKRLLTDSSRSEPEFTQAAEDYVRNLNEEFGTTDFPWLFQKPYGRGPHRRAFFSAMYQIMNLLEALDLPEEATLLEVGSGPGWITETLACLGFRVECVEPCADMVDVARKRVASRLGHHRFPDSDVDRVRFHTQTLEDCPLEDACVDAVLFYEALHHIVDENKGIAQCYRVLKPWGAIGITGESVWSTGNVELENDCREEMRRFGTLENPFSAKYLTYLLQQHGFVEITRYHAINGMFPESEGHRPMCRLAQFPSKYHQNVIARKPASDRDGPSDAPAPIPPPHASRSRATSGEARNASLG